MDLAVYNLELSTSGGISVDMAAATVVGDTVGDPFKDTSSVAMNPIIKFTTLFGLLAVELAEQMTTQTRLIAAAIFFVIALVFVWRSFYGMRIEASRTSVPTREPVGVK